MDRVVNWINGRFEEPVGGAYIDKVDPATGARAGAVANSDARDVDSAARAARHAFDAWHGAGPHARSRILLALADLIDANLDPLARAECVDSGKPLALCRAVDIPRSASNFRYFATAVLHTSADLHEYDGGGTPGGVPALNYTLRRPRGVAGCISPWNLPLYLFTWKIAPALATGNTVVAKPSELTPTTGALLGDLAKRAGMPDGVLNIVQGTGVASGGAGGAGGAIVEHPDIPAITFTGSTGVGRWIGERCGRSLKRASLELGGKNAFMIFADAELDGPGGAIETAVRAAFTNQGQICLCGSRLLVERPVYERVLAGVVERAKKLVIGDPLESGTQQGALVSAAHRDKVAGLVEAARGTGGRIECGGGAVDPKSLPARVRNGFFYRPTVVTGLDADCRVEREEIFGPVVSVSPFDAEAAGVARANACDYGLAATIFTRDLGRAHRVAAAVEAGIVWVNCWLVRDLRTPFGGVKQSGVGREGGLEALRFFTESKNVCVRSE
jgi:aminomuconate-semialdehyde/2-hydroxymuconate-6-semialdehyde dehydrogenase